MHCPAHSLKSVGHDPPQLVPSHVADPPIGTGQATQAMPQLATSVLLTHCPVQMCVPAPQIVPTAGASAVDLSMVASTIASTLEPPAPALPPSTFNTRPVLHACRPTMKKINWAAARQSRALAWTNRRRRQTGAAVMLSLRRRREKIPLKRRRRPACRAPERSSVTSMNLPSPPPWSPAQKHQTVAMGVRPVKSNSACAGSQSSPTSTLYAGYQWPPSWSRPARGRQGLAVRVGVPAARRCDGPANDPARGHPRGATGLGEDGDGRQHRRGARDQYSRHRSPWQG